VDIPLETESAKALSENLITKPFNLLTIDKAQ